MRTTGFGFSAVLIAAGAILAWAVTHEAEGIDLNEVGIILFVVGIGLGLVTLAVAIAGRNTSVESRHDTVVDGHTVREEKVTEYSG
ncbi:MAG: hypothetical protein DHS20C19_25150 [Acidimicrobiales bacterium]|nr:MAG: hypothetical protein DHS20C19_25150 [Acidimicrobiales bacterium]